MNPMTRILITGSGGMLGDAFYAALKPKADVLATDIDLNESWLTYLDVRDYGSFRKLARDYRPDAIIHLAALTDVEWCETHPEEAYLTNSIGTENASAVAKELNATLFYVSTAGIFDGRKAVYDDWDAPNPISVYGRSKYGGEKYVVEQLDRYFVCRAGWMMGGGPRKDKKFVHKLIRQIESGATELYVVDDKLGTPTYTHDFAKNAWDLMQSRFYGVYNMACNGECSRFDIAVEVLRILGRTEEIALHPVTSAFFREDYFAPRPPSEQLLNMKLQLRGLNRMGDWKQSLEAYIHDQYPHVIRRTP